MANSSKIIASDGSPRVDGRGKYFACDEWGARKIWRKFPEIRKINRKIFSENRRKSRENSENRRPKSAKIGALFGEKNARFFARKITGEKRKTASKNRAKNPENFRKIRPVLDVRRRKKFGKIKKNNFRKIRQNSAKNFRKSTPLFGQKSDKKSSDFWGQK